MDKFTNLKLRLNLVAAKKSLALRLAAVTKEQANVIANATARLENGGQPFVDETGAEFVPVSARAINVLLVENLDLFSIRDLTTEELKCMPNVGAKTLLELEEIKRLALEHYGPSAV